tara:strand:- start:4749 stop:5498 length:750 start_codon:yes stop_codon:yes gene_type:complete
MQEKIQIIKFDTKKFDFNKIIYNHFKKRNKSINKNFKNIHNKIFFKNNTLHNINEIEKPIYKLKRNYFDIRKDQKNKFVKFFYKIDPIFYKKKETQGKFIKLYFKLIKHIEKKHFREKIIFQKKPTLRVHVPDNISVGSYHVDSDYGHPNEEINFWLPFNECKESATLWVESKPNKGDFKPINLKYGEILIFNSKLAHGTEVNKENYTRLSMDFRIIKKKKYKDYNSKSPLNKIKFSIGNYFMETTDYD